MKRIATTTLIFLQLLIILIAIGASVFLLWEPTIEGRNAHATLREMYLKDPFLVYTSIASLPFFAALVQAFKALEYVKQKKAFSKETAIALRIIRYCALSFIGLIAIPEAYLLIARPDDDIAGGVAIGMLLILISTVTAIVSTILERTLRNHPTP